MKKNPSPASEAKIDANRENAKKSTGPRTDAGKEASSRNGLKHGLCADKHLLPGEQPDDLCAHLQNLLDTFRPVGEGEEKLVLRIAAAQWRLDRAFPMEAGILRERFLGVAVFPGPSKATSSPAPSTPTAPAPTPSPSSSATKVPSSAPSTAPSAS